jgi:hypothetical protein
MDSIRYLTPSHLAELTGKDRATVRKRLEGLDPYKEDGRARYYDAHKALPLILLVENTQGLERQIEEETLRQKRAAADKAEIAVAKERGLLVEVESIGLEVEQEYTAIRARFLALGSKLALTLAPECSPGNVKIIIDNAINEILSELSLDQKYLDLNNEDESREQINPESSSRPEGETDTNIS